MPDNFSHFKVQEIKSNNPPSKFDITSANFLLKKLREKRQVFKSPNIEKWSIEFQKLRTVDEIEESRIKSALTWYCKNIRGPYIPVILSARSFRSKFISELTPQILAISAATFNRAVGRAIFPPAI